MSYNKTINSYGRIQFIWDPQNIFFKNLNFEKTGPLLPPSLTGYISIPIWITIISKLKKKNKTKQKQNKTKQNKNKIEGASGQEIL